MYQGLPPVHRCGTYLCSWDTHVGFQRFMVFKGFLILGLEPGEGLASISYVFLGDQWRHLYGLYVNTLAPG